VAVADVGAAVRTVPILADPVVVRFFRILGEAGRFVAAADSEVAEQEVSIIAGPIMYPTTRMREVRITGGKYCITGIAVVYTGVQFWSYLPSF